MVINKLKDQFRSFRRLVRGPDVSSKKIADFLKQFKYMHIPPRIASRLTSLAIVVPCFSHDRYLCKMFESIISQTCPADEVILVDDCSPDQTGEILTKLIQTCPSGVTTRFSMIKNSANLGQAASLNRAISAAKSELVLILNDDDYLMHDLVDIMFSLFNQHRDVALIGGTSIHFTEEDKLTDSVKLIAAYASSGLPQLKIHHPSEIMSYRNYNDLNMGHSGCCFLKSAWEIVGGYYPEKKRRLVPFSDRDFQLRVCALYPVAVSNETPLAFWRSNSSVDNRRNS